MNTKSCIACGMPMETHDDYAMKDPSKDYCCYCMRPNGEMKSYDEKLQDYAGWLMKTQGLSQTAALSQTKVILSQLPAWKNQEQRH